MSTYTLTIPSRFADLYSRLGLDNVLEEQENGDYSVAFEAPGFAKDELSVTIENDVLIVKAEKKDGSRRTRTSSFELPSNVDPESISAKFQDCILTVTIDGKKNKKSHIVKIT